MNGSFTADGPAPPGQSCEDRTQGRLPGLGAAATQVLFHRYDLDGAGMISGARIVPPTSQNQAVIENDMRDVVEAHLDLDDAALTAECEKAIRNYDPCISCAAHFLDLTMDRT